MVEAKSVAAQRKRLEAMTREKDEFLAEYHKGAKAITQELNVAAGEEKAAAALEQMSAEERAAMASALSPDLGGSN